MHAYEMPLLPDEVVQMRESAISMHFPFLSPMLIKYALWFCHFRWIVAIQFTVFGLLRFFPGIIQPLGLKPQMSWAFFIAGLLVASNTVFILHIMKMRKLGKNESIMLNIWAQIITDLIILTGVVHFAGSLDTYISFAYIFHIVLACIFFSYKHSFFITLFASLLFVSCVMLEEFEIIPAASIYLDGALRDKISQNMIGPVINLVSALSVWFIVWYLASHLSALFWEREYDLVETNARLKQFQAEKTRHMLRTTHELKAPFASIHANTQLLLKGYCGTIPEKAIEILNKISIRCNRLTNEILEMLQIASLESANKESLRWTEVDIADILKWCLTQVQPLANERMVKFKKSIKSAYFFAVEDYMKLLFSNILSNAVNYSHKDGVVRVKCRQKPGKDVEIIIEDEGIGIQKEKLPNIFKEYYRTGEASKHNEGSSGLGLYIVKNVAQFHNIRIQVASELGVGTKFTVSLPSSE